LSLNLWSMQFRGKKQQIFWSIYIKKGLSFYPMSFGGLLVYPLSRKTWRFSLVKWRFFHYNIFILRQRQTTVADIVKTVLVGYQNGFLGVANRGVVLSFQNVFSTNGNAIIKTVVLNNLLSTVLIFNIINGYKLSP